MVFDFSIRCRCISCLNFCSTETSIVISDEQIFPVLDNGDCFLPEICEIVGLKVYDQENKSLTGSPDIWCASCFRTTGIQTVFPDNLRKSWVFKISDYKYFRDQLNKIMAQNQATIPRFVMNSVNNDSEAVANEMSRLYFTPAQNKMYQFVLHNGNSVLNNSSGKKRVALTVCKEGLNNYQSMLIICADSRVDEWLQESIVCKIKSKILKEQNVINDKTAQAFIVALKDLKTFSGSLKSIRWGGIIIDLKNIEEQKYTMGVVNKRLEHSELMKLLLDICYGAKNTIVTSP